MTKNNHCKICGQEGIVIHKEYPGYQEGMKFTICNCPECNTNWPQEQVDVTALYDTIYRNSDKIAGYKRYKEYVELVKSEADPLSFLSNAEPSYFAIGNYLRSSKIDKNNFQILEVGCGYGYLTYALNSVGYNAKGVDISNESIEHANENFGDFYLCADILNLSKTNVEKYDLIILTEVIEHISNPKEFLVALKSLISTDGKILVTTPNKSIFLDGTVWASDIPPIHQTWLSEQSFEKLALDLNMDLAFLDFSSFNKRNPQIIYLEVAKNFVSPPNVIGANGEVLKKNTNKKSIISKFNSYIKNTALYTYLGFYVHYFLLKYLFGKKITYLTRSSTTLGVLLSNHKPLKA